MASLRRRPDGRVEIRETVQTARGPRSRTLASFRGSLSADVLDQAARRARRPFDPAALRRRARELALPVLAGGRDRAARALLRELRAGGVGPVLVGLLRGALEPLPASEPPEALAEVAPWLGASDEERGAALRGLLRTYDRVARSRGAVRAPRRERFPRFHSVGGAA